MQKTKAQILAQLQHEILPLQGFKPYLHNTTLDKNLGPIKDAFPGATFPLGALHEFIGESEEASAATNGFIATIVRNLMHQGGSSIWIHGKYNIFPPALRSFGIAPEKIIFLDLNKEKEILWVMEEALKCNGVAAVIGQVQDLDFAISRRLQLAVEQSKVTGFIYRYKAKDKSTTASLTRWKITPLPSIPMEGLPGVGFPCWNVELLKVKNGKPKSWQIECINGILKNIERTPLFLPEAKQKTA